MELPQQDGFTHHNTALAVTGHQRKGTAGFLVHSKRGSQATRGVFKTACELHICAKHEQET